MVICLYLATCRCVLCSDGVASWHLHGEVLRWSFRGKSCVRIVEYWAGSGEWKYSGASTPTGSEAHLDDVLLAVSF